MPNKALWSIRLRQRGATMSTLSEGIVSLCPTTESIRGGEHATAMAARCAPAGSTRVRMPHSALALALCAATSLSHAVERTPQAAAMVDRQPQSTVPTGEQEQTEGKQKRDPRDPDHEAQGQAPAPKQLDAVTVTGTRIRGGT